MRVAGELTDAFGAELASGVEFAGADFLVEDVEGGDDDDVGSVTAVGR